MDYSVGSLSDLITGSKTPNKLKVVKKEIKIEPEEFSGEETRTAEVPPKKKKIKKEVSVSVENESKKRTLEDADEPSPKKAKKGEKVKKAYFKKNENDRNAERRISYKATKEEHEEDPELLARTVFVGNLPISQDTKKLKKFFNKFGKVDAVRIRGAPVADPKTPKKVAIIKKEFHPDRKSLFGFVRFEERESAIKATEANGVLYHDHHLRVRLCGITDKPDETKAIFIGNLSFYAEEEDLWKLFESCGPISSVRIVRDSKTGIGKGFGYVNFENPDSVTLALEMEDVKLKDRELRISICNLNAAKKNKKNKKVKKINKPGKPKKVKEAKEEKPDNEEKKPDVGNKPFQGIKFADKKKKNKLNKGLVMKKRMVKKVAPK